MIRRLIALLALCTVALIAGATPALAHTRLQSSDPADGASLAAAPAQVSLTFNQTMQAEFATITVIGPDGTDYRSGEPTANGQTVTVGVAPLGPAGRYEIGYRVVSEDGHPVPGNIGFTLTAAAATTTAAPPASATAAAPSTTTAAAAPAPESGGAPVWPWIVGAVVLVAGGAFVALRMGR